MQKPVRRAAAYQITSIVTILAMLACFWPAAAFAAPDSKGDNPTDAAAKCGGLQNVVQRDNATTSANYGKNGQYKVYYRFSNNPKFNTWQTAGTYFCYNEAVAAGWVNSEPQYTGPVPAAAQAAAPRSGLYAYDNLKNAQDNCAAAYPGGYNQAGTKSEVVVRDIDDMNSGSSLYQPGTFIYVPLQYESTIQGSHVYFCRGDLPSTARNARDLLASRGQSNFNSESDAKAFCSRNYPGQSTVVRKINSPPSSVPSGKSAYATPYGRSQQAGYLHGDGVYMCLAELNVAQWVDIDSVGGIQPAAPLTPVAQAHRNCGVAPIVEVFGTLTQSSAQYYQGQQRTVYTVENGSGFEQSPSNGNYYACLGGIGQPSVSYADFQNVMHARYVQVQNAVPTFVTNAFPNPQDAQKYCSNRYGAAHQGVVRLNGKNASGDTFYVTDGALIRSGDYVCQYEAQNTAHYVDSTQAVRAAQAEQAAKTAAATLANQTLVKTVLGAGQQFMAFANQGGPITAYLYDAVVAHTGPKKADGSYPVVSIDLLSKGSKLTTMTVSGIITHDGASLIAAGAEISSVTTAGASSLREAEISSRTTARPSTLTAA